MQLEKRRVSWKIQVLLIRQYETQMCLVAYNLGFDSFFFFLISDEGHQIIAKINASSIVILRKLQGTLDVI